MWATQEWPSQGLRPRDRAYGPRLRSAGSDHAAADIEWRAAEADMHEQASVTRPT